jgi:hypothetical protein
MSVGICGENIACLSNQINQCFKLGRWNFILKIGSNYFVILARWFLMVPPKDIFALHVGVLHFVIVLNHLLMLILEMFQIIMSSN